MPLADPDNPDADTTARIRRALLDVDTEQLKRIRRDTHVSWEAVARIERALTDETP